VRPTEYREINNFYTATVYEKGAEIIRMLKTLIGADAFDRGMALYFERHDGQAATVEQFIACFAEASQKDLSEFFRWYEQAGTPIVRAREAYDIRSGAYSLTFAQHTPPTPGQADKKPVVIPIALGLLDGDGQPIIIDTDDACWSNGVYRLSEAEQTLIVRDIPSRPVASLLRGFSAPVRLDIDQSDDDLILLLKCDSDPFNRWQASQQLAIRILKRSVASLSNGEAAATGTSLAEALAQVTPNEATRDPAFAAYLLALPRDNDIAREIGVHIDPDIIHAARVHLRRDIAKTLASVLSDPLQAEQGVYSPDAKSAGQRAFRHAALSASVAASEGDRTSRATVEQFYRRADNLTDRHAALLAIHDQPGETRDDLFSEFESRYRNEPLVLDKWLALQATIPERDTLTRVRALMNHPIFSLATPNRVYALLMSFAQNNPREFHRPDGVGHAFVADMILELDQRNPQVAARLATSFRTWRILEPGRRASAQAALERLKSAARSRDVADIVSRTLA